MDKLESSGLALLALVAGQDVEAAGAGRDDDHRYQGREAGATMILSKFGA